MGLRNKIRSFFLHNLDKNVYKKLAERYNDFTANYKEFKYRKTFDQDIVNCNYPLVYISQPPRCGGTITRNLFDGHPLFYVFPYELSWEKNGYHWEETLGINKSTLHVLKDKWISHAINHGFDKQIPFYFNRDTQRRIFLNQQSNSSREVLGAYFTSFFNAWINYQNLRGDKKYCIAFCPWTIIDKDSVDRFFNIYPDGYRIHIIRNPLAWWASEKSYEKNSVKDINDYLESHWIFSTNMALYLYKNYPGKYILVDYDQLIKHTQNSMGQICHALNVPFDSALLVPTLNNTQRASNTSHGKQKTSIDTSSLDKWQDLLDKSEVEIIKRKALDLYKRALEHVVNK